MSGRVNWLLVLRTRDRQRWRLVHRSGAVLAQVDLAYSADREPDAGWSCSVRHVDVDARPPATYQRHARAHRPRLSEIEQRMRDLYADDRDPPSLDVEPMRRGRRRAARRAIATITLVDRATNEPDRLGQLLLNGELIAEDVPMSIGPAGALNLARRAMPEGTASTRRYVSVVLRAYEVDNNRNP